MTYYELLEVARDASADDIKRAFRREIAKYHPDKVQHLGKEFQDIAARKAAELTQAYKTLSDSARRADYDDLLAEGGGPEPVVVSPAGPAPAGPAAAAAPQSQRARYPPVPASDVPGGPQFQTERQGVDDLMRRATVMRFQNALMSEFGKYEPIALRGFEVAVLPTPSFWSLKLPPRVLGRFVPHVDGKMVAETWGLASKMKKDSQRDICVFLMGPSLASATELAVTIAEQRKRPMPAGGKLVLIPVNTKDWSAHVPTDAPNVCKALLNRLKSNT